MFIHLLNDFSGSPRVLASSIEALYRKFDCKLYTGSGSTGVLDQVHIEKRLFFYKRYQNRYITMITYVISQFILFFKLFAARDIHRNAIIYVNTLLPFGAMLWGKLSGRQVLVHVHEVSLRPKILKNFLVKCTEVCADKIVWVSNDHVKRMPISCKKKLVLFNTLDHKLTEHFGEKIKINKSGRERRILMLASLRRYKGVEEFAELSRRFQGEKFVQFDLVLNDEKNTVNKYKLKHASSLTNVNVYHRTNDPGQYYIRSDLVLNLSRVDMWIETFGLTVLEAMSFGLPVIAPPVGGCTELIEDGKQGFLIDSRNIDLLEQTIRNYLASPNKINEMSKKALKRSQCFSFDRYAERLERFVLQS